MSPTHGQKPQQNPDIDPEKQAQQELNQAVSEESGSDIFGILIQLGLAGAALRASGREEVVDAIKMFQDKDFPANLKILDQAGNIDSYLSAKKTIDAEIDRKFSDKKLKKALKKKEITQEEYNSAVLEKFQKAGSIKVGIGKGKFGAEITYDEHLRNSQASEVASEVHAKVDRLENVGKLTNTAGHFKLSPEESQILGTRFSEWQGKNPHGSFDDFLSDKGLKVIRKETVNGKSMSDKEFKEKSKSLSKKNERVRSDVVYSLSGMMGDQTTVRLNKTVDYLLDENNPHLTPEQLLQQKEYIISGQVESAINLQQSIPKAVVDVSPPVLSDAERLAQLEAKGFNKTAEDLVEIRELKNKIAVNQQTLTDDQSTSQIAVVTPPPVLSDAERLAQLEAKGFNKTAEDLVEIRELKNKIAKNAQTTQTQQPQPTVTPVTQTPSGAPAVPPASLKKPSKFQERMSRMRTSMGNFFINRNGIFQRTATRAGSFLSINLSSLMMNAISGIKSMFNGVKNMLGGGGSKKPGLPFPIPPTNPVGIAALLWQYREFVVIFILVFGTVIGFLIYSIFSPRSIITKFSPGTGLILGSNTQNWKSFEKQSLSVKDEKNLMTWSSFEKEYLLPVQKFLSKK
jgi:hypothetical protein